MKDVINSSISISKKNIRNLCSMGFPEEQVKIFLKAAFDDPEIAVNYLVKTKSDDFFEIAPKVLKKRKINDIAEKNDISINPLFHMIGNKYFELMKEVK
mmetsp:Transcript_7684/g.11560  ORF Transcript_7684/g.11560 Transcript_7684/m.11560 type:complete len:99 (-) Transcript_7684:318-614(-)|eukprot:CAMPEP_0171460330 /NCGR_PEP_ID=MMETSP0945-20130129/5243_1 /TAXON_ID=109269 /ORGANISM="Vaucheria litorea, Strain CCMP2940" /LENGTH=98 /DNA_ID=CAMNT_0011986499 /DNA_START=274 /DNA_END=570 /DNA_ORIENTATION=-